MAIGPIAGTAFVKFDGMQYQLRGELEVQPNISENEWIANGDLTQVYTQKGITPYIAMKISDSGGLSVQALNEMEGVVITAELINGKVYVLMMAAPWGEIKLDATKGEITAKFGGEACFETLGL